MTTDWTYNGIPVTTIADEHECFVYLITSLVDGRKYIGKKTLKSRITKPPLKGKKRKRRIVKESDWRTYYGSSDALNAEVLLHGVDNFTREVIHWCESKSEASYMEAYEQMMRHVLLDPMYFNSWISVRVTKCHLVKISQKYLKKS